MATTSKPTITENQETRAARAGSNPIAWVVPDQLSDNSIAFNVVMDEVGGARVVIGAMTQEYADRIAAAINDGATWVEVQP